MISGHKGRTVFRYRERMDDKVFLLALGLVAALGIVVIAGRLLGL